MDSYTTDLCIRRYFGSLKDAELFQTDNASRERYLGQAQAFFSLLYIHDYIDAADREWWQGK